MKWFGLLLLVLGAQAVPSCELEMEDHDIQLQNWTVFVQFEPRCSSRLLVDGRVDIEGELSLHLPQNPPRRGSYSFYFLFGESIHGQFELGPDWPTGELEARVIYTNSSVGLEFDWDPDSGGWLQYWENKTVKERWFLMLIAFCVLCITGLGIFISYHHIKHHVKHQVNTVYRWFFKTRDPPSSWTTTFLSLATIIGLLAAIGLLFWFVNPDDLAVYITIKVIGAVLITLLLVNLCLPAAHVSAFQVSQTFRRK